MERGEVRLSHLEPKSLRETTVLFSGRYLMNWTLLLESRTRETKKFVAVLLTMPEGQLSLRPQFSLARPAMFDSVCKTTTEAFLSSCYLPPTTMIVLSSMLVRRG